MAKNLLKYETVQEFEAKEGAGSKDVVSVEPGVAYVLENEDTAYNPVEIKPTPGPEIG